MKIGMIQMSVVHDKQQNLDHACRLTEQAAAGGIDMAVLPEMFCCPYDNQYFAQYGEEEGGPAWQTLSALAARLGTAFADAGAWQVDKIYNTSYVFDRQGRQIAKHRKTYLFDIDVPGGQRFFESEVLTPGDQCTVFDTEFGRLGLCICFDFRFQELAKAMGDRGAQAIIVPAAFNMTTGPAHWELMFRQRAVDNQLFTLGVAPARNEQESYVSYGNSMAVDPWGTVLARLDKEEAICAVELDFARNQAIRAQLPILASRKPQPW